MKKNKLIKNLNQSVLIKNTEKRVNRLMIGMPCLGTVRSEFMFARYSQIIPTNWSAAYITGFMSSHMPLDFQVADAYNLVSKSVVEGDYEWLLTIETDNLLPPDGFVRMNEYMKDAKVPVVSGLYFTKSNPAEPVLYRGQGTGCFQDWTMGDKVWVDGIPNGFTLIHGSITKAMWKESPEYIVNGTTVRRIYETPNYIFKDPETGNQGSNSGTQDLAWCKRVIDDKILEKSGWGDFAKQHPKYPFLVDTDLYCLHISTDGVQYPIGGLPQRYVAPKDYKPREIIN